MVSREMDLANIIKEKSNIKCDILGLSETWQQKELHTRWKDGSTVGLGVGEEQRRAYAPTSAAEDEEIERFYEELEEAMNTRCTYLIVMGDFNAKVECRKDNKAFVGPSGGERNEQGEWLVAIAESRRLFKLVEEEDWSIKDDISDDYNSLVDRLRAMRQKAELPHANHQTKQISDATKTLLEKRRQMKQDAVLTSEVRHAIEQAATDKAPRKDGIEVELLKAGGATLWAALAACFSKYMRELHVPRQWEESKTILFKKGDKELLKNYWSICLLSALYKTFTKIILNCLTTELDEQQSQEQTGF
uniref:Endonuclease/exonuclease/phosphatase domain-containing protein n=1 Tax=Plectus sambesii TaxID=2011161 RepID=A0A914WFQ5_9BILA